MRTYSSIIHAEHLKQYINEVVLVISFANEASLNNLKNEYQIDIDPSRQHFLSGVNYFVGLRITRKQSKLEDNSDEVSKEVIKKVKPAIYGSSTKKHKTEMKSPVKRANGEGYYEYSNEGSFMDAGGYVLYIPGSYNEEEAIEAYDQFDNSFVEGGMISLVLEFLIFNVNHGQFLYKAQKFLVTHQSTITISEKVRGFDPTLYSTTNKGAGKLVAMYILAVVFQLLIVYCILKLIFASIYYAMDFFSGKRVYVSMNDIISLIVVGFSLTSVVYWYKQALDLK